LGGVGGGRVERVGPTDRGWRRGSLYRGDGEEVLVYGEKKGGDRGTAGEVFYHLIPYITIFFCYWG
jgi:hypothetical protein